MPASDTGSAKRWLHRGNLRDIIIVLAVISSLFLPTNWPAMYVGLAVLAVGTGLHVLVKGQLIREVALCTEGTYALARHPYYLANFIIDTGFCLLSGNIYLVAVYPFLFFWAYGPTFREEEAVLASIHGEKFHAYKERVPQVFPHALSFKSWKTITASFSHKRVSPVECKRICRFWYVGMLIPLLHHLKIAGIRDLLSWHIPTGVGVTIFALLCAAFLILTLVIPCRDFPPTAVPPACPGEPEGL